MMTPYSSFFMVKNRSLKTLPFLLLLILLGGMTLNTSAATSPRAAMRSGLKFYKAGDYTNAIEQLKQAEPEFPQTAHYNLGNAHFRAGNFKAATEAYTEALYTSDLKLQANTTFNLGNTLLTQITVMDDPEQIDSAIALAFQAQEMYEKTLRLNPADLDTKQNFERALSLWTQLESTKGDQLFDRAEALLQEYNAGEAKPLYEQAKRQFEHFLADVDPNHRDTKASLFATTDRLEMLAKAVADTEENLQTALQQINDYQYLLAAQRLTTDTDERKYAFSLKPKLAENYEATIQKNSEIIDILKTLSTQNM